MARLRTTPYERDLLARLMRAEAESDGEIGMMLVGMVGINRVVSDCSDFKNLYDIEDMVYQNPGGFEAIYYSYFYQAARPSELRLVDRLLEGERFEPGTYALWFYNPYQPSCPAQWWGNWNSGRYGEHCFYIPSASENCNL